MRGAWGQIQPEVNVHEQLDKFSILMHLQRLLPDVMDECRQHVLNQVIIDTEDWEQAESVDEFNARAVVHLEALCRDARDGRLSPLERRRRDGVLTRRDLLKATASAALSFNFETDIRDDKIFVNVTPLARGKFTVAIIERRWFPDFKRLHPVFLKNGERLYKRTTREVNHFGKTVTREVPVISIAAAAKVGKNFDSVFLTARPKNGCHLDLTFDNIVIPCMEATDHVRRMNTYLATKMTTTVGDTVTDVLGNVPHSDDPGHAKASRPTGESPEMDGDDDREPES
jgi:hypothetical protein